ncbi:DUF423 domain-containing protein [Marinomonas ostreistagni]|nr:DUF423 domain-containing protein [Marinomonas ostreistagni]
MLSVAAGAFGAHGLKNLVGPTQLEWWQTACQYLMYHSLAGLLAVGMLAVLPKVRRAPLLFSLGNLLFAGSLAVMTLTDLRTLGMITPIGGVLYLLGWLVMILGFIKPTQSRAN